MIPQTMAEVAGASARPQAPDQTPGLRINRSAAERRGGGARRFTCRLTDAINRRHGLPPDYSPPRARKPARSPPGRGIPAAGAPAGTEAQRDHLVAEPYAQRHGKALPLQIIWESCHRFKSAPATNGRKSRLIRKPRHFPVQGCLPRKPEGKQALPARLNQRHQRRRSATASRFPARQHATPT